MDIINLFINFTEKILSFKIFDIKLSNYLLTFTLISIVILIIKSIANTD